MASAYTPYTLKGGKVVQVPNAEVSKLQKALGCSRAEAVDCWLYDHEYIDCPEANELTEKAKENKVSHNAKSTEAKPKTQRERVVKEHPIKEELISIIAQTLTTIGATEIKVENKQKLITFIAKDGEPYAIDLKWERNKSKAMKSKG